MFFVCVVTCSGIKRLGSTGSGAAQRLCGPNPTPKPPFASINGNAGTCPIAIIHQSADSCTKPRCEPRSFADQAILIEVVNTKERPGIFERHLHIAGHCGGSQSELRIGEFETAAWARKRDVEGFAGELVDLGTRLALQDARYLDPCRPTSQVGLDINRQE